MFAGNKCDIPRERQKVLKETVSNYVHYDLPRLRTKVSLIDRIMSYIREATFKGLRN